MCDNYMGISQAIYYGKPHLSEVDKRWAIYLNFLKNWRLISRLNDALKYFSIPYRLCFVCKLYYLSKS